MQKTEYQVWPDAGVMNAGLRQVDGIRSTANEILMSVHCRRHAFVFFFP